MFRRMPRYLLAALLFLAQTALLAHQSNIDVHLASSDDCAICHVAPSLDGVVSYAPSFVAVPVIEVEYPSFATLATYPQSFLLPGNRSPPQPTGL